MNPVTRSRISSGVSVKVFTVSDLLSARSDRFSGGERIRRNGEKHKSGWD
jgi:hypothetical protein